MSLSAPKIWEKERNEKHRMVDGRLLQMNKRYGQLKQKQKEKISG